MDSQKEMQIKLSQLAIDIKNSKKDLKKIIPTEKELELLEKAKNRKRTYN